jgi:hypothetical protein
MKGPRTIDTQFRNLTAAVIALAGLLCVGVVPANAVSSGPAGAQHRVERQASNGTLGIGTRVTVRSDIGRMSMKPIPGWGAPDDGLALSGDNIAAICELGDDNNVLWVLSLDRNGRAGQQNSNTVGFIPRPDLVAADGTLLPDLGICGRDVRDHFTTVWDVFPFADMKPIPGTDANDTGIALPFDDLAVFCSLPDNNNLVWQLVVDPSGRTGQQSANTAGFVQFSHTTDGTPAPSCGVT